MIKINSAEVGSIIDNVLKNKKKNLLFVSRTLETDPFTDWFENHPDYLRINAQPRYLFEEGANGRMIKNQDIAVIPDERLIQMNSEKTIVFLYPFGEQCIAGFDGFLDILRSRKYTNRFSDGDYKEFDVSKLGLFIGLATPSGLDWASLNEKYYNLFDEVYTMD